MTDRADWAECDESKLVLAQGIVDWEFTAYSIAAENWSGLSCRMMTSIPGDTYVYHDNLTAEEYESCRDAIVQSAVYLASDTIWSCP
jgi:hypothetical protein